MNKGQCSNSQVHFVCKFVTDQVVNGEPSMVIYLAPNEKYGKIVMLRIND